MEGPQRVSHLPPLPPYHQQPWREQEALGAALVGPWLDSAVPGVPPPAGPESTRDGFVSITQEPGAQPSDFKLKMVALEVENCEMAGKMANFEVLMRDKEAQVQEMQAQLQALTRAMDAQGQQNPAEALTRAELVKQVLALSSRVKDLTVEKEATGKQRQPATTYSRYGGHPGSPAMPQDPFLACSAEPARPRIMGPASPNPFHITNPSSRLGALPPPIDEDLALPPAHASRFATSPFIHHGPSAAGGFSPQQAAVPGRPQTAMPFASASRGSLQRGAPSPARGVFESSLQGLDSVPPEGNAWGGSGSADGVGPGFTAREGAASFPRASPSPHHTASPNSLPHSASHPGGSEGPYSAGGAYPSSQGTPLPYHSLALALVPYGGPSGQGAGENPAGAIVPYVPSAPAHAPHSPFAPLTTTGGSAVRGAVNTFVRTRGRAGDAVLNHLASLRAAGKVTDDEIHEAVAEKACELLEQVPCSSPAPPSATRPSVRGVLRSVAQLASKPQRAPIFLGGGPPQKRPAGSPKAVVPQPSDAVLSNPAVPLAGQLLGSVVVLGWVHVSVLAEVLTEIESTTLRRVLVLEFLRGVLGRGGKGALVATIADMEPIEEMVGGRLERQGLLQQQQQEPRLPSITELHDCKTLVMMGNKNGLLWKKKWVYGA